MNLRKKKILAAKTLGVGKDRIVFNTQRLEEIKEAITKQDIRDLADSGAIKVLEPHGRLASVPRKNRRRAGKIKMRPKAGKHGYVLATRALRAYVRELLGQEKITKEKYHELRKEIRTRAFKNKAHLRERITNSTKVISKGKGHKIK